MSPNLLEAQWLTCFSDLRQIYGLKEKLGVAMKKTYEKPVLTKRERLATVAAGLLSPVT
ncbi:hypothetical protein SAMN02927914_00213 [Mesorhizobium qingshengii]|uniref:Uncharacterized protein n=1 Tax=Mesorhizobium qingshengii TaxID=1165689 RepID=A0A1G5V2U2_9HYPH|nr:hypothetical protein SAMN02927914_00213 [Mesorhizobium qingshengii]